MYHQKTKFGYNELSHSKNIFKYRQTFNEVLNSHCGSRVRCLFSVLTVRRHAERELICGSGSGVRRVTVVSTTLLD